MDQSQIVRATLEFERGSDPPRGQLLVGEAVYPFAGWLGLAVALEYVIDASAPGWSSAPTPADG